MAKVWHKDGLEVHVEVLPKTKKGIGKLWVRIQGELGSQIRLYESLSYARSADICFVEDPTLKPRKPHNSSKAK